MKIDGKQIASAFLDKLHHDVQDLSTKGVIPHLVVLLVGNDPASEAYVRQKKLKGESIDMNITILTFPENISEDKLLEEIDRLNKDHTVHGIIIQQPLPKHIDPHLLTEATGPKKDVDGFHSNSNFTPPIAEAAIELLHNVYTSKEESHSVIQNPDLIGGTEVKDLKNRKDSSPRAQNDNFISWLQKKSVVIIGKGETGGTPIREKLEKLGTNVTTIDSKTENPQSLTKQADIIISCVGKPNMVKKENIKQGVILLSVGMFRGEDGKLHGDYEEEDIKDVAGYYSPVPGGMGPVNVAMLLSNVYVAATSKNVS